MTDDEQKDESMSDEKAYDRDPDGPTERIDLGTAPTMKLDPPADGRREAPAAPQAAGAPTAGAPTPAAAPAPGPAPAESWPDLYRTSPRPAAPSRAYIRWGGVVWGVLLAGFAGWSLWVLSSAERIAEARTWSTALTPWTAWALGAAVLGVIIAVSALLGGISAAQRRRERRRA